ncbi:MAG: glycoside hydrolase family 2 protein [Puniceicoccales bacterium]|nr:glycoside hydrolase family 2 protein [Puniceicoccales bacterium]
MGLCGLCGGVEIGAAAGVAAPPVAPATPPTVNAGDPFSANAFRVERDNLGEKAAPVAAPAVSPVAARDAGALPYTGGADGVKNFTPAPRFEPWAEAASLNDGWAYCEEPPPPVVASETEMSVAKGAAKGTAKGAAGAPAKLSLEPSPVPPAPPEFLSDAEWSPVTLPHTWNARDTVQRADYRRGVSWYRKTLKFSEKDIAGGHRWWLRFGAAGQSAVVYINGAKRLEHAGGYDAFALELRPRAGENEILVRVSNEKNRHLPPLSGDFNQYGGLYRGAWLLRSPAGTCFSREQLPAIATSDVSAEQATLKITPPAVLGDGAGDADAELRISVYAPEHTHTHAVASERCALKRLALKNVPAGGVALEIKKPFLWTPETPALYTVVIELVGENGVLDSVRLRTGFRSFRFTADDGFFLNGKPYKLLGINRHQDCPGLGNALPDARHDADLRLLKRAGFNFVRLAHYQQDDYVLQRCDELGLLVWEEIPLVNVVAPRNYPPSETLAANAKRMMRALVTQHRHHPSIIVWGLGNEISFSAAPAPTNSTAIDSNRQQSTAVENKRDTAAHHLFEKKLIADLHALAKHLDPSRPTILVSHDSDRAFDAGHMSVPDLNGYNLYKGWYRDTPAALTTRLAALHAMNPTKPLLLSEFGAGSDPWLHTETPRRYDQTEEYAVALLENYRDQFDAPPLRFLAAHLQWVFADFGAAHRIDTHPYINNKGLLDANRRPKDLFYFLQARQQRTEPVLYLQTPSWTTRGGNALKRYRVFSNMDEVELFHDGVSLGKQTRGFVWNVTLRAGANALLAKGRNNASPAVPAVVKEHGFTVNYDPTLPAQISPVMPKR